MKLQIFNNGWQDVQGVRINTLQDEITKDESYDNATIEARNLDAKLCERWSKFRIVENDGEIRYYYGSDKVTRLQMSKWYIHKFELVEPTKFLERFFIGGLSVTQNLPEDLRTIPYAVKKAINDINEKYGTNFYVNTDIYLKLNQITCPEYVVTAKTTFFEFLTNYIGKKINAMPRLLGDSNGFFNEITFDYFNEIYPAISPNVTNEETSKPQDNSATYLEAEVSNMITENENNTETICYPYKNGYTTVRAEEIFLNSDNADIILPYPIKEIKSVWYKGNGEISVKTKDTTGKTQPIVGEYDITDQIYTKEVWETFLDGAVLQGQRQSEDNKKNTFYYEIGNNKLFNVGGKNQAFLNWEFRSIKAVLERHFYKKGYYYNENGQWSLSGGYADVSGDIAITEIFIKIEYIPYNDKIITTQVNPRNKYFGSLTYNQSAENTNSDEFGNAMWNELQNTNTEIKQMTARVSDKTEVKKIGDIIDGRIITSVKRQFTGSKWINVLYTANEEFIRRSQYIEENREYRPYSIPQETIVDRHLHTDEFCYIDYFEKQNIYPSRFTLIGKNVFYNYLSNNYSDNKVNNFILNSHKYIDASDKKSLFLLATIGVAIGKSIQFNWKCESNFAVGRYLLNAKEDKAEVVKARYTDVLGGREKITLYLHNNIENIYNSTLDTLQKEYLSSDIPILFNNENNYPSATPDKNAYYVKTYENLGKDAGERLMGSVQLHFVTQRNDITISNNFAKYCPMVSSANKNLKFVLTDYQVNKYTNALPENASIKEVNNVQYYGASETEQNTILIDTNIDFLYPEDVSWAIIDEEKNLYLGGNALNLVRENDGQIYLTFTSRLL